MGGYGKPAADFAPNRPIAVGSSIDHYSISTPSLVGGTGGIPLVVTGDFNAAGGASEPWKILVEESPLEDAWTVAAERHGEVATGHGWKTPRPGGARIDWVLVRGVAGVSRAEALLDKPNGVWPSDHLPIRVDLTLPW